MFQLAPVSVPLLGADFLEHFNLLVNIKGKKVVQCIHAQCLESLILHASPMPQPAVRCASFHAALQIQKLLSKFLDMLSSDGFTASKPWSPTSSSHYSRSSGLF